MPSLSFHLPNASHMPAACTPCPARALLAHVAPSQGSRLCILFLPAAPSRCSSSVKTSPSSPVLRGGAASRARAVFGGGGRAAILPLCFPITG